MACLLDLPAELIIRVLTELDYEELLCCKQTCKHLNEIVDTDTQLQYIIGLAASGMEDSGFSTCSLLPKDRLRLLKDRHDRWNDMRYTSITKSSSVQGGLWELQGGILSQSDETNFFVFTQLPSKLRGVNIEARTWILRDLPFQISDFTCDPAQDLLAVVARSLGGEQKVHLRSLTTGEVHQEAADPGYLTYSIPSRFVSPHVRLSGTYIGVLLLRQSYKKDSISLTVWDWRTGDVLLCFRSQTILGFVFLTERHVMIVHRAESEPILSVLDFKKSSGIGVAGSHETLDVFFELSLQLPSIHPQAEVLSIAIRSDPAPSWTPHSNLKLPFHLAQSDRLFVITIHVMTDATKGSKQVLLLFVPTSTVMYHLAAILASEASLGERIHQRPWRRLDWEEWGPTGTRMIPAPSTHSHIWVCYVLGMAYVSLTHMDGRECAHLLDFNPAAVKVFRSRALRSTADEDLPRGPRRERRHLEHELEGKGSDDTFKADSPEYLGSISDSKGGGETRIVDEETIIPDLGIFDQEVKTSLPYLSHRIPMPTLPPEAHLASPASETLGPCALMLSEDAVVLVYEVDEDEEQFITLNF